MRCVQTTKAQTPKGDKTQPNSSFKTFEIEHKQELLGGIPCWGFAEGQTRLGHYPIWP